MITKILYGVKEGENTFLPPAESARACSWVPKIARTVWIVDKVTNDTYNERVPVIQVMSLIAWSAKKAKIVMNVEIVPYSGNGLTKRSVADCLQTRPLIAVPDE